MSKKQLKIYRKISDIYTDKEQAIEVCKSLWRLIIAISKHYCSFSDADCVLKKIADVMVCFEQIILNMADCHDCEYEDFEYIITESKRRKIEHMEMCLNTGCMEHIATNDYLYQMKKMCLRCLFDGGRKWKKQTTV